MDICVNTGMITKRFGVEDGYRAIAEAGFTAVDWSLYDHCPSVRTVISVAPDLKDLCIFERPLPEILDYFRPELEAMKKNGLRIAQLHAPFPCYAQGREDILDYSIANCRRIIELADAVGCPYVVIHGHTPAPESKTSFRDDPAYIDALNRKLYESLIDTVKKTDVVICMENLYRSGPVASYYEGHCSDPHQAVAQIDELNAMAGKECFGLCMDTGHLNMLGKRFYTYVPVLGHRLKCLHIHDNPGIADSHLAPYSGTVVWNEFTEELKKIGYRGDLSFETGAQIADNRLPMALAPTFLKLICEIGKYFRKEILD